MIFIINKYYAYVGRPSSSRLWIGLLAFVLACGGPSTATPKLPENAVQAEIDRAQDAETQRDYIRAQNHYETAISLAHSAPTKALAHRELAAALVFWGAYDDAIYHLKKSLSYDGTQVPLWHDLGVLQARKQRPKLAEEALQRGVGLAPNEPRTRIALAALLVSLERFDDAVVQYQTLLRLRLPSRIEAATRRALQMLEEERGAIRHGVPPG